LIEGRKGDLKSLRIPTTTLEAVSLPQRDTDGESSMADLLNGPLTRRIREIRPKRETPRETAPLTILSRGGAESVNSPKRVRFKLDGSSRERSPSEFSNVAEEGIGGICREQEVNSGGTEYVGAKGASILRAVSQRADGKPGGALEGKFTRALDTAPSAPYTKVELDRGEDPRRRAKDREMRSDAPRPDNGIRDQGLEPPRWYAQELIPEGIGTVWSEDTTRDKESDDAGDDPWDWVGSVQIEGQGDAALQRARRRNIARLKEMRERDEAVLSKYLPSEISSFFPLSLSGPVDRHKPREEWLRKVIELAEKDCEVPKAPEMALGVAEGDLDRNAALMEQCEWDLMKFFELNQGTTVDHGSEFRPVDDLERIVGKHPNFGYLKDMLESGFDYFVRRELTEEERIGELEAQMERGNHKSATQNYEEIAAMLAGDVKRGFILTIRARDLRKLRRSLVQPCGLVRQFGVQSDGTRKLKSRMTHDLSFSLTLPDASVNSRINWEKHPSMVYGWCFSRLIHFIVCLRLNHPDTKIYISKFDYSDAYKRISHRHSAASSTIIVVGQVAYVHLRMAFGGSPNPAGFSCFSEMLTDLANEIAMSGFSSAMYGNPTVLDSHSKVKRSVEEGIPIRGAIRPAVEVDVSTGSFRDCFIDDIIDCHLGDERNLERAAHIVQLAVRVMSRPHAGEESEPLPRKPLLGPDKLEAEGRSSEVQTVLGWKVDTRRLQVSLPDDKFRAWSDDLVSVLQKGGGTRKELESMVGRLNHSAFLIPLSRHFLNEIRVRINRLPRLRGQQLVRLSFEELEDLRLWTELLKAASEGVSMNLLTIRNPTRIAWSDSCPFGIGGYTLSGRAWRIRIPDDSPFYGDDTVNNVLEFLGMAISIMLMLKEASEEGEESPCILALGDNTSAIAWIYRSGRVSKNQRYYPAVKFIARSIARAAMGGRGQVCSQHLPGKKNVVSDLLSFEGNKRMGSVARETEDCPPDDELTLRIHQSFPQEIPSGFRIQHLPSEIEQFAVSVLRILSKSWKGKPKRRWSAGIGHGGDGEASSKKEGWEPTLTSIRYPTTKKESSWQGASWRGTDQPNSTAMGDLLDSVRSRWYHRLFGIPLAMWHRRSGNVEGPAPSTSRTETMLNKGDSNIESRTSSEVSSEAMDK